MNNMSLSLLLKKLSLLFLLVSASLLSVCFAAGRPSKLVSKFDDQENVQDIYDQEIPKKALDNNEVASIHERLLKVNTKDYGRYDPAPALVRPPFKLIPN